MGSNNSAEIIFHNQGTNLSFFKERIKLKQFIIRLLKRNKVAGARISFVLCGDVFLRQINIKFLNHNYLTDVITFDLSENDNLIGEVYISIDRIRENAAIYGVSIKEEFHRVVFHGVLHLMGYTDKSTKARSLMSKKEDELLNQYFK